MLAADATDGVELPWESSAGSLADMGIPKEMIGDLATSSSPVDGHSALEPTPRQTIS